MINFFETLIVNDGFIPDYEFETQKIWAAFQLPFEEILRTNHFVYSGTY